MRRLFLFCRRIRSPDSLEKMEPFLPIYIWRWRFFHAKIRIQEEKSIEKLKNTVIFHCALPLQGNSCSPYFRTGCILFDKVCSMFFCSLNFSINYRDASMRGIGYFACGEELTQLDRTWTFWKARSNFYRCRASHCLPDFFE